MSPKPTEDGSESTHLNRPMFLRDLIENPSQKLLGAVTLAALLGGSFIAYQAYDKIVDPIWEPMENALVFRFDPTCITDGLKPLPNSIYTYFPEKQKIVENSKWHQFIARVEGQLGVEYLVEITLLDDWGKLIEREEGDDPSSAPYVCIRVVTPGELDNADPFAASPYGNLER